MKLGPVTFGVTTPAGLHQVADSGGVAARRLGYAVVGPLLVLWRRRGQQPARCGACAALLAEQASGAAGRPAETGQRPATGPGTHLGGGFERSARPVGPGVFGFRLRP